MKLISFNEVASFEAGDKTLIKEILNPSILGQSINYSLAMAELDLGATSVPHQLKSSEVYHIIQGQASALIEGKQIQMGIGDTLYIAPNEIQSIKNTGTDTLQFLCIVSPPWKKEDESILPV